MPARVCCPSAIIIWRPARCSGTCSGRPKRNHAASDGPVPSCRTDSRRKRRRRHAEETVHRPHVVSLADQPLHQLEGVDVGKREAGLDAVFTQRLMFSR